MESMYFIWGISPASYSMLGNTGVYENVGQVLCIHMFLVFALPVGSRIQKRRPSNIVFIVTNFHVSKFGCPEIEFDKIDMKEKMMMDFVDDT